MAIKLRKRDAVLLIGICIVCNLTLDLFYGDQPTSSSLPKSRRYLREGAEAETEAGFQSSRSLEFAAPNHHTAPVVYPWARDNLEPHGKIPDPSTETVLLWHVPKSGGSTAKAVYECLGVTLADRAGVSKQFGHKKDKEIEAFRVRRGPGGPVYVNVETRSKAGIMKAKRLGLIKSGLADLIFTSDPSFAIAHMYDKDHKGRVVGLFRHPVERLVSKFYYLQMAKWEKTYKPEWKDMSVLEFAVKENYDNDHMVKKLAGIALNETASEEDLLLAMRTVESRFIVGLTDQMEESIYRFNMVIGLDVSNEASQECMGQFFGPNGERRNANPHPHIDVGGLAWVALVTRNSLDVRLYNYILQLFDEQKELIELWAQSVVLKVPFNALPVPVKATQIEGEAEQTSQVLLDVRTLRRFSKSLLERRHRAQRASPFPH